jgi:hypothetical protein
MACIPKKASSLRASDDSTTAGCFKEIKSEEKAGRKYIFEVAGIILLDTKNRVWYFVPS